MPRRHQSRDTLHASRKREEGQTMAEYAVALAVITVTIVAAFPALGAAVSNAIQQVAGLLP
jgi:Flp pilus assembly pilin Flp